ncbi:ATP-grasp domain-containing protein [Clostridium sp. E02]|uniref:ATP-grasp domain-containing protein n=1 Tax=Clostridium sp. E02 TaxID=2487134 RepID=UPI000F548A40|nr:ATP-grasp domain-containing protein [Clostridium sp. E02]
MNTVVVTAIGSFSADVVIKNLKNMGIRVIGCDIYPREWIADSMNVDSFYQVPYATDEAKYVEAVLSLCEKEKADGLLVLTDVEVDVWNRNREFLEKQGVLLCLSKKETIEVCRDKRSLYQVLREQGVGNPIPTIRLNESAGEEISFPMVIKPYNGRSSQGLFYLNTQEEYDQWVKGKDLDQYVKQPFLKGSILTVDVVRQEESNTTVTIGRRELLRTASGAGTSVFVFSAPQLEAECEKIAQVLQIRGCVNFEFIETEDKTVHFLECNPRFSGGVEFSCMAGYDCISNHIRCFTEDTIDVAGEKVELYIARKYEEYITKRMNGRTLC